MERLGLSYEFLWGSAIAVIPLALGVGLLASLLRHRPGIRHALWMVVMLSLVAPAVLAVLRVPRLSLPAAQRDASMAAPPTPGRTATPTRAPAQTQIGEDSRAQTLAKVSAGDGSRGLESLGIPVPMLRFGAGESGLMPEPSREYVQAIGEPGEGGDAARMTSGRTAGEGSLSALRSSGALGEVTSDGVPQRTMIGAITTLRDAIGQVPMLPRWLWAGGAACFGVLLLIQLERLRRTVRRASPVSSDVQREVARLSDRLGLGRVPMALFVEDRLSPMISCGFTPRVLLPRSLWEDLDAPSREAVLLHELAHLRRKDHLVCWFETILGVAYWWHPVVWFVRRRIQQEADACCDAWVVSVLPRHRRAYAEALVTTRAFIGGHSARALPCSLGMTSPRAKRFTRRLSMVMTLKMSPRVGGMGLALASAALGAGALLTPALACPPDEVPVALVSVPMPTVDTLFPAQVAGVLATVPQPERRGGDMDARLRRLEQRVDRLIAAMELGREGPDGPQGRGVARPPAPPAPSFPQGMIRERIAAGIGGEAPQGQRAYALDEGKLDALWALMAREDVPVFVSRGDEGTIVLHGTPDQQRVFADFIAMINGAEPSHNHQIGETDEARSLLERALQEERIRARGAMEDGHPGRLQLRNLESEMRAARDEVYQAQAEVRNAQTEVRQAQEQQRERRRRGADENRAEIENLMRAREELRGHLAEMERHADELEHKAQELEDRAQELEEQGDELIDEGDSERGKVLLSKAESIWSRLDQLEEKNSAMEEESDALEQRLEEIEEMLDRAREHAQEGGAAGRDDDCDDDDCDDDDDDGDVARELQ